ncbi:MAG: NADH-ubiquinone oxidoreductase-F iron-sulfur binding region domain-containing protein [Acidimicrobiia bacterium]|nr:NADH-ubiquinone oxidoreductase-F iron-sulfur binding region domain-containing protein [Acidimicrobiia bacterium]
MTSPAGADGDHVAYGGLAAAADRRHLLLPVLNAVQGEIGWVSHGAINEIGRRLPVSPAEAYGVAQFYDLIATEPRPPRVANVCDDIACKAAGVDPMITELRDQLGRPGEFGSAAAWVRSPCLGQCEKGSAAYIQIAGGEDITIAPATPAQIIDALSTQDPSGSVEPTPARSDTRLLATTTLTLDHHESQGGLAALRRALGGRPSDVVDEIEASGLRGRGGAAFPAGIKWRAVSEENGPKYVVCNADESEPGTFKDRVLMEADPFSLLEALTIAGYAVGASRGYVYIRGEYPVALRRVDDALAELRGAGYLGPTIAGSEFSFDIEIRKGAGAYICGEETALFNSIEGFRGEPRQKPPFPTQAGLFGRPTLVNNVESLMNVPDIVLSGGAAFAEIGTASSTGPKLFCVSGNVREPGVYEAPFGVTTNDLIEMAGGIDGELTAVLVGGAAGSFLTKDQLDIPLTFEDTTESGISLGSGVVLVFNESVDMLSIVKRIAHFFSEESCGLCVPCRVGTVRQEESIERIEGGAPLDRELRLLHQIDGTLRDASICGLGQFASNAVQTAIEVGLIGADQ